MTKKSKLVKQALKNPELFSTEDLQFFDLWLRSKKKAKEEKKAGNQSLRNFTEDYTNK